MDDRTKLEADFAAKARWTSRISQAVDANGRLGDPQQVKRDHFEAERARAEFLARHGLDERAA